MREQLRIITALFADLAGSTSLAERLEPEEYKLVISEATGRVVAEVERLGGYVKDLAGDGVLAFFGAPTSYEDDAERAARTALNIVNAMSAYGLEVARAWGGKELAVRVGISTGPVALGTIGSKQRVEYAAFGDTVNTAARLQSVALPGTILVDAHTQRLIEPLFVWSEPRDLELKGKSLSVRAFPLRAARPTRSHRRGLGGIETAIVGRDRELARMREAFVDVRAGRGSVVLITGEAGLGKSRLLAASHDAPATESVAALEPLWLEGRCVSYGETVPYFPFLDLIRDWLGVNETDPQLRVRIALQRALDQLFAGSATEIYPYLASLLGSATEESRGAHVSELTAEELQHRTFAAVRTLLERLAQDRPVVVALEDLHWADATSTQLAKSLLPAVERSALLLVITQRDERDRAAWELTEAAARDFPHLVREIALEPLPRDAETALLHALVGAGTLTNELERRLLETADGNPLYLEELVRSLVDAGALTQPDEGVWRLDRDVQIAIPETVQKVILARVDRLPPNCHDALAAASVVGRRFDISLLAGLVPGEPLLHDALHELQRLGFVTMDRRWPEPEYRFSHALIQEAVYGTILAEERARLHRAAALSLERREQETQEAFLTLARHWSAAGEPRQAIPYFRRGAELALTAFANAEAVEALGLAVELVQQTPEGPRRDEEELEIRTILGPPLVALGGYGSPAVGEDYARARDLCLRLGRPVSSPILRGLAINSLMRIELDETREHGRALLAAGDHDQNPTLLVEAHYVLGVASFWLGEFTESRNQLEQAIAGYSPERHAEHVALYSQDPKVICLSRLAWTLWFLGFPDQAARTRDAALSLADDLGHPFSHGYATAYAVMVSQCLGDERRASELAAALETLATEERLPFWRMFGAVFRCWSRAQTGDPSSIEPMKVAIDKFAETGQTINTTYMATLVARAYLAIGDPLSGLDTVAEALEETERTGARYLESELQRLRGELLRATGAEPAGCRAAFRLAHDIAQRQEAKLPQLRAAVALAHASAAEGTAAEKQDGLRILDNVYSWFIEGHDNPDLRAARQLLSEL